MNHETAKQGGNIEFLSHGITGLHVNKSKPAKPLASMIVHDFSIFSLQLG